MQFLSLYEPHFKQSLINTQVQTLKILVWLITVQKTIKIESLTACFLYQLNMKTVAVTFKDF